MPKLYEYQTSYHRVTDTLRVSDCGQGVYIGVNTIVRMPIDVQDCEETSSIVIPSSEIEPLIQALAKSEHSNEGVFLRLTGVQLKQIIESMKLSVEVLECEVNHADMPYDLIEMLKGEFDALLERDKQSKKDT